MALILNLETSTTVCSVSLAKDGNVIALKKTEVENSHSKILTVFIEDIFKENNIDIKTIDAVAVSKGPGSYTGLRIGVSAAKGIAYGLSIPLISINTLKVMVAKSLKENPSLKNDETALFAPMIDARRMEVYTAFFNKDLEMKTDINATIIDENSYLEELSKHNIHFFGNGSNKCKGTITCANAHFIENIHPSADNMAALSEEAFLNNDFEDVAYFEPFYLKDFIAAVSTKHIFG